MIPHSKTAIAEEDILALNYAVSHGKLAKGSINFAFQKEFQEYLGVEFVHLTSSGTMAFFLILKGIGLEQGDEVLLPDYICKSLLGPILNIGAKPVLYDNSEDNWISDIEKIRAKITERTRVILINHTFGQVFEQISQLKKSIPSNIEIVEDCCHAIMPKESSLASSVGHHSLCSFYSFNATKLLAAGEGGAVVSNDKSFMNRISSIEIGDYLSDLSCSLARAQLSRMDYFLECRKQIAAIYLAEFGAFVPKQFKNSSSAFFRFTLLVEENRAFWKNKLVSYRKGVDSLLSEKMGVNPLPNALKQLHSTVSLPIYPSLNKEELAVIIDETHKILMNASSTSN